MLSLSDITMFLCRLLYTTTINISTITMLSISKASSGMITATTIKLLLLIDSVEDVLMNVEDVMFCCGLLMLAGLAEMAVGKEVCCSVIVMILSTIARLVDVPMAVGIEVYTGVAAVCSMIVLADALADTISDAV